MLCISMRANNVVTHCRELTDAVLRWRQQQQQQPSSPVDWVTRVPLTIQLVYTCVGRVEPAAEK